jgi:tripartite-type tricarboxylate transporter receptor subunit TctC
MRTRRQPLLRAVAALCLAVAAHCSCAQQFAGQDVNMVVNYTAGGPTDIEARLVAQFLPKFLAGVRAVVVRNVGGAGGNIGVNQLGNDTSGTDRLSIGFFTWDPMDQLIGNESLRVRYNDLRFVAGFKQVSLVYARKDIPPGLSRPEDIAKVVDATAAGLSPTNHATVRQRLALDLLGVKYRSVAGYRGLHDIELAIHRGEVNIANNSLPGWYATIKPQMVDTGLVIPLFQYDYGFPDGRDGRSPDLTDVPSFSELFHAVRGAGAAPSGEKWEALQLLSRIMDSMYRTVFMPPTAPPAAVEEMRVAFQKLSVDPEFIAAYEKVVRTKPRMIVGRDGDAIIQQLGSVQPSMVSFLKNYVVVS